MIYLKNLQSKKGFTLIELLVVIAILGVLVVGLMVAINPADKLAAANDARVQSDFGAVARAAEGYSVAKNASYPQNTSFGSDLVANGDLKYFPTAPAGYTYTISSYGVASGAQAPSATCTTTAGDCLRFTMFTTLKSKNHNALPVIIYDSGSGQTCYKAAGVTATTAVCP